MGVKYDLISVLHSQFFEYLREKLSEHALEHPGSGLFREKKWAIFFFLR